MSYELIELGRVPQKFLGRPAKMGLVTEAWGFLHERLVGGLERVGGWFGLDRLSDSLSESLTLSQPQTSSVKTAFFLALPSALCFGLGAAGSAVPIAGRFFGRFGWGFMALGAAGMAYSVYDIFKNWNKRDEEWDPEADALFRGQYIGSDWGQKVGIRLNALWKEVDTNRGWVVPWLTGDESRELMEYYRIHKENLVNGVASLGPGTFKELEKLMQGSTYTNPFDLTMNR